MLFDSQVIGDFSVGPKIASRQIMPRPDRIDVGNQIYHVMSRAVPKRRMFRSKRDYLEFCRIIRQAMERVEMRLLAYCFMPNHWHMVLGTKNDGDLSSFIHWLLTTHVRRHHERRSSVGSGHLYQGRYKSFLLKNNDHLLTVCRYVERNALSAGLVKQSQDWRWGSLHARVKGPEKSPYNLKLSSLPIEIPGRWAELVDAPLTTLEQHRWMKCAR